VTPAVARRYPEAAPSASGLLEVGDGHEIYWETVGNPAGTPAVYLHGGPGSGCGPGQRRSFDPAAYRAVLFDQRGCGRSRPLADGAAADLSTNTTEHLLGDIERLREHLGIDRWVVAGGSWGVTLALAYAQRQPDRVAAMVLAAVTSGRRLETDWITRDMRRVFPREWDAFAAGVPAGERDGDLSAAYARLLASPDPAVTERAAQQWCDWEDTHVSLMPGWEPSLRYEDPAFRRVFARLVTHYWSNGCFLDDTPIAAGMHRIAHIPAVLIHGRYDVSSPLDTAWDLHRAWPASRLVVLDDAGHGGTDMTTAITAALDTFRTAH
jgi:proline iminopeptidase